MIQRLRRLALQRPIVEPGSALATAVHAPAEGALDSVANAVSAYTLDVVGGAFRADVLHCETFHLEDPSRSTVAKRRSAQTVWTHRRVYGDSNCTQPMTDTRNLADITVTISRSVGQ